MPLFSSLSQPAGMPPRVPTRYSLLARVASGATASVWHARDALTGEDVALKIIASDQSSA